MPIPPDTVPMPRTRASRALTLEQTDDLLGYLEERLRGQDCDGSTRHVTAFLLARRLQVPRTLRWVLGRRAYCDCEVWMNVR